MLGLSVGLWPSIWLIVIIIQHNSVFVNLLYEIVVINMGWRGIVFIVFFTFERSQNEIWSETQRPAVPDHGTCRPFRLCFGEQIRRAQGAKRPASGSKSAASTAGCRRRDADQPA